MTKIPVTFLAARGAGAARARSLLAVSARAVGAAFRGRRWVTLSAASQGEPRAVTP